MQILFANWWQNILHILLAYVRKKSEICKFYLQIGGKNRKRLAYVEKKV